MAVKASVTITISKYRDTDSITRYYKLQASTAAAPAVPTTLTPSGWSTSEPTYTSGSTNTLYYTDRVVFSDGTFQYTDDGNGKSVKSSSYEAAKEAYNKAQAAQSTANATQENLDNLDIGGKNLLLDSKKETLNKTTYLVQRYTLSEDWIVGDEYTLSIKGDVESGKFGAWRDNGSMGITYSMNYNEEKNLWWYTFECPRPWNETNPKNILSIYNTPDSTTHNSSIEWIKLEKGNKPTDWTPAPEDIDADIDQVNKAVNEAHDIASNASTLANTAYTMVNSLNGSITNFVSGGGKYVRMDQSAEGGMQLNMGELSSALDDMIERLENTLDETEAAKLKSNIQSAVETINGKTKYITADDKGPGGSPRIVLGDTSSPFKVEITNQSINFLQNGEVIAYANGTAFFNLRTVVQQDVQIGLGPGFIWKTRESGNMGLTWVPASS